MTVQLANITFDCDDPKNIGRFWSAVLDRPLDPDASPYFASIGHGGDDVAWLFIKVPEPKTAKNRVHVDLKSPDLAAERTRLESLGATFVHEKDEYGVHWCTFRDPEGNELCVAAESS